MFTQKFLSLDADTVKKALAEDGVFAMDGAMTADAIAAIAQDVAENRTGFNRNGITGSYYFHQFYLCHMLAVSRTFTRLVTHPKVFDITERIIGPDFRLKALRYYETYGHHRMQWHTDNKTSRAYAQIPGIIFIAYISDVADGEFQYVKRSHRWSGENAYNDYSDAFVAQNFAADIARFKGAAGTIIIYDTYGIHRASPVEQPDFVRKSLFWQIDREVGKAEPILLNPEFLEASDSRTLRYLGFGLPTGYERFPHTDVRTIAADQMAPADFAYLQETMTHDLRIALNSTQTTLAEARHYIRTMPVHDIAKVLARAAIRQLPSALRQRLEKRFLRSYDLPDRGQ